MNAAPKTLPLILGLLGVAVSPLLLLATRETPEFLIASYALAFLPYFLVLFFLRRTPTTRALFLGVLLAGVLLRILFLPFAPVLSDDIYRYVWDGRVAMSGINPFAFAPQAEELRHLRDAAIWPLINHPTVPTIYPPAAQLVFQLNALRGGGIILLRALFLGFEAIFLGIAWWLLRRTASPWSIAGP